MIPIARSTALRAVRAQWAPRPLLTPAQSASLARLLSTLAVLEQKDGKLNTGSLGAVTAGSKLGGSVHGFIAGKAARTLAQDAAKINGLEKVIAVENEAYERGLPENWAPLLVENIKKGGYTHVIASHSAFGKSLLPRVAALLDVQQISDVMRIEGEDSKLDLHAPVQLDGTANVNLQHSSDPYTLGMRS
jgi:electron transfer flavoprotein alpha subunit